MATKKEEMGCGVAGDRRRERMVLLPRIGLLGFRGGLGYQKENESKIGGCRSQGPGCALTRAHVRAAGHAGPNSVPVADRAAEGADHGGPRRLPNLDLEVWAKQ